jgi:hypothetical protein
MNKHIKKSTNKKMPKLNIQRAIFTIEGTNILVMGYKYSYLTRTKYKQM